MAKRTQHRIGGERVRPSNGGGRRTRGRAGGGDVSSSEAQMRQSARLCNASHNGSPAVAGLAVRHATQARVCYGNVVQSSQTILSFYFQWCDGGRLRTFEMLAHNLWETFIWLSYPQPNAPPLTSHLTSLSIRREDVRVTLVKNRHGGAAEELSACSSQFNLSPTRM